VRFVDAAGLAVLLVFGTATSEGLARGAGGEAAAAGALAGALVAALAGGLAALAWLLGGLLGGRSYGWAAAVGVVVLVLAEVELGRRLLGFRDPTLVAAVAAAGGVVLAWTCAALVVPLVARIGLHAGRAQLRAPRWSSGAAALVVIAGTIAAAVHADGPPRSRVAAAVIGLAAAIGDVDGDGAAGP
jgi:hypothetical protein